jgi:DNA ligase-1
VAEALSVSEATRARTRKVDALAAALVAVRANDPGHLGFAARFLGGALLPVLDSRALGVGWALLLDAASVVTGVTTSAIGGRSRQVGDLGTAIGEAVSTAIEAGRLPGAGLRLGDAAAMADGLAAASTRDAKRDALEGALRGATALEARYLARALLGEMRVGAKEGLVLDAIAAAFARSPAEVRRAAGIVADVGELAVLAAEDMLAEATVAPGRPLGFMLATPLETARGVDLTAPHAVEDKIDGMRAQVHVTREGIAIFARGKGRVTTAFPDLTEPLARVAASGALAEAILDGEIVVATDDGRPRPFSALQPRLKKTEPDAALLAASPVRLLVYDMMWEGGQSLLDQPFGARRVRLAQWTASAQAAAVGPRLVLHASRPLPSHESREHVDAAFEDARARGWEGLVLKRVDAPYQAGVRGFSWLKVKKAFGTLDVVVVGAERGHGRRHEVLSDYTFAVRDDDGALLTVGKAYSGLTDAEIREMTARLVALATADESRGWLPVRPEIVLEVAFDGVQRSERHASGYALRFPRIARVRDDKTPADASTVADVRGLFEAQLASGHRESESAGDGRATGARGRRSGRKPDVRARSKQLKLWDD